MVASPRRLRSACPTAAALDIVGDRWILVVLRDVLVDGPVRFKQLLQADEQISTNVLTDRLRRMEDEGLIVATPYQQRPPRFEYSATPKGEALFPVLEALATWGQTYIEGVSQDRLHLPPAPDPPPVSRKGAARRRKG